jgi:hypothetical protein
LTALGGSFEHTWLDDGCSRYRASEYDPGMPGGRLVVSSNGTTGVVWGTYPVLGDGNSKVVPGALVAYDATPAANGFDVYRVRRDRKFDGNGPVASGCLRNAPSSA